MPFYSLFIIALCLFACQGSEPKIRTYRLAKLPQKPHSLNYPDHWQALSPGSMRQGLFKLYTHSQEDWELSLSFLPAYSGSEQANIQRWQKQLGEDVQAPNTEEEKYYLGEAKLYYFQHQDKALWVAKITHDSGNYYVKLIGKQTLVNQELNQVKIFIKNLKKWPN